MSTGNGKPSPLCGYCGLNVATTADHIPPKLLLSRPYPENLVTVPACRRCNSSFQSDDEYTRFVVSVDLRAAKHDAVQSKMPAIIRSLQRPAASGFATYLFNQMTASTVLGPDGLPMGQSIEVDRGRVNATGKRMVQGFFSIETGNPLPASARIRVESKAGVVA